MKILLKGYYGFGNLGDDILLKTTWKIIKDKHPEASISVFSNFNKNLKGFQQFDSYNNYIFELVESKPELVDWTSQGYYDILIDGGGGIYFDYRESNSIRSLFNSVFTRLGSSSVYFIDKLLRSVINKRKKIRFKKRVGIGIGIGPYTDSSPLLYDHLVDLGSTHNLFVRDSASIETLNSFGYSGKKFQFTDLAFLTQYWLPVGLQRDSKQFQGRIGIILLDWHEYNTEKFHEFKRFAFHTLKSGNKVTFFSFDENTDKEYIKEFQGQFKLEVWRPNQTSLKEFLELLASQDIVLSARAHGVIISSLLGVPTITLGSSKKLIEVSKMFPISSPLLLEPFTTEAIENCYQILLNNYAIHLSNLKREVEANQKLAAAMVELLNANL